ncbi:PAS domain S-box protein [Flaviaesturariibacter amylovorans]|uniref:Oxygen sensor histidine kinase NreB n=1 Tax=Flaviaesturariibacter amylovorans TaxID=1084520 RepID=A0ABP8GKC0_9BACT
MIHALPPLLQRSLASLAPGATDDAAAFTLDRQWQVTHWNAAAASLFGREAHDTIGQPLWQAFPDTFDAAFYQQCVDAAGLARPVHFEYEGAGRWLDCIVYPCSDGLTCVLEDISAPKAEAARVAQLHDIYRNVFQATSDAIWHWNLDEDFVFRHGEHFRKQFGYDIVDTVFPTALWHEVVHPDDMQRVLRNLETVLADPAQPHWSDQYRYKRSDGSFAHVLDTGYILRDDTGRARTMIGALRDITETELAKQALLESRNQYQQLFDSSPLAKWIYDERTLRILEVNRAALKQYGYTREAFLQLNLLDLHPKKEQRRVLQLSRAGKRSDARYEGRWHHLHRDGSVAAVEIASTGITYEGTDATIAVVHDITEQLRLQDTMLREKILRQKELTRVILNTQEKERHEIATELHDNINQVLTTIKLYLEIALTDEAARPALIEKSYRQTQAVINEIRSLCRTIIAPTHTEPCLVHNIRDLIASYEPVAPFTVHFDAAPDFPALPPEMSLTLFRITQEALNNVVKYAGAQNIWITLSAKKGCVRLKVRDDGAGFQPARRRKGVGITNMQNRASLYGGRATISSAPGLGCTLEVELPVPAPATTDVRTTSA